MKKTMFLFGSLVLAASLFVGCASTNKNSPNIETPNSKVIDYPGAALGRGIPAWLQACEAKDNNELDTVVGESLNGKYYIVSKTSRDTSGIDTKILRNAEAHARSAYARDIATTLATHVIVTSGEALGEDAMEELTSVASKANISGFTKEYDGYLLISKEDPTTGRNVLTYNVYQIYATDMSNWVQIQKKYLNDIIGNSTMPENVRKAAQRADEMIADIENQIKSGFGASMNN